jgi:hypothetical protein
MVPSSEISEGVIGTGSEVCWGIKDAFSAELKEINVKIKSMFVRREKRIL